MCQKSQLLLLLDSQTPETAATRTTEFISWKKKKNERKKYTCHTWVEQKMPTMCKRMRPVFIHIGMCLKSCNFVKDAEKHYIYHADACMKGRGPCSQERTLPCLLFVCVSLKLFFFFKNTDWAKWTVSLFYSYLTPFYFLDILLTHWVCESKRNLSMSVFLCVGSCVCGQILISKGWTLVNSVRSVPSLV